jgi:hypothetical protein
MLHSGKTPSRLPQRSSALEKRGRPVARTSEALCGTPAGAVGGVRCGVVAGCRCGHPAYDIGRYAPGLMARSITETTSKPAAFARLTISASGRLPACESDHKMAQRVPDRQ